MEASKLAIITNNWIIIPIVVIVILVIGIKIYFAAKKEAKYEKELGEARDKLLCIHNKMVIVQTDRLNQFNKLLELDTNHLATIKSSSSTTNEKRLSINLLKLNRKVLIELVIVSLQNDIYKYTPEHKVNGDAELLKLAEVYLNLTITEYTNYVYYPTYINYFIPALGHINNIVKMIGKGLMYKNQNASIMIANNVSAMQKKLVDWHCNGDKGMKKEKERSDSKDIYYLVYEEFFEYFKNYLTIIEMVRSE